MRSLKIIVFRDTDKPYTMILPAALIIGLVFGIVALASLFTFSVMSNVMLMADNSAHAANDSGQTAVIPVAGQEDTEETDSEGSLTEEAEKTREHEQIAENLVEDDNVESLTAEGEPEDAEIVSITPLMLEDSSVEAILLTSPEIGEDYISISAQVQKRLDLGTSERGKFIVALLSHEGQLGPAYPDTVQMEGHNIITPEQGNDFRISYRRSYDIRFPNIDPEQYSALVLYIYDQEATRLQWRNIISLNR
jgi:hypothetical protein